MAAKKKAPAKKKPAPKAKPVRTPPKRKAAKPVKRVRVAPAVRAPAAITETMTLGDLGRALGVEPAGIVAFLRQNLAPCAHDHSSISVFQTAYTCRVHGSFHAATCEEHADHAPCPKCRVMSRRSGIRTKSG